MDEELISAINNWQKVPLGSSGRANLDETDLFWKCVFERYPELRYPEGRPLYRIFQGGDPEPEFGDFPDWEAYGAASQKELFDERHKRWEEQRDPSSIRFDGHWVSFTKAPEHFMDSYYASKSLRGLVIEIKARNAVDISSVPAWGNVQAEQEVVAPMNRSDLIRIMPFDDLKRDYFEKEKHE